MVMSQQPTITTANMTAKPHNQTTPSQASPMDQLQGLLNIVLTTIGQTLNDPIRSKDPAAARPHLQVIPQATHRFHDALDKLEQELKDAQFVMRRDYGVFLREKMKREENEKALGGSLGVVAAQHDQVVEKPAEVELDDDAIMADITMSVDEIADDVQARQVTEQQDTPAVTDATAAQPTTTEVPPALDQKQQTDQAMQSLVADPTALAAAANDTVLNVDDLFGDDANLDDLPPDAAAMDLDAMFGIGTTPNGVNTALNATTDSANGVADLNSEALADQALANGGMDLSFGDDGSGLPDGGDGDVLAGLEDYANIEEGMDSDADGNQNGDTGRDLGLSDIDFGALGGLDTVTAAPITSQPAQTNGIVAEQPKEQVNGVPGTDGDVAMDVLDFSLPNVEGGENFDDFFNDLVGDMGGMGDVGGDGTTGNAEGTDDWSWLNN